MNPNFLKEANLFYSQNKTNEIKLFTDAGNGLYSWGGNVYKSDAIRFCIRPYSKAVGKLIPKYIKNGNDSKLQQVYPETYLKLLLADPNPYMSGQMLQGKMAAQLKLNNNAFSYILRDEFGHAREIYPLSAAGAETIYDNGTVYIRFILTNGELITFPYSDIIHLRQEFYNNEIFGDSPIEILKPLLEIVKTPSKGFFHSIKNNGIIKWFLNRNGNGNISSQNQKTKDFRKLCLSPDDNIGDIKVNNKSEDTEDYLLCELLKDETITKIYNLFGTNEKIIQSKYTTEEWLVYYESEIEPIAKQLSDEYTRKLFSRYERECGNSIVFTS